MKDCSKYQLWSADSVRRCKHCGEEFVMEEVDVSPPPDCNEPVNAESAHSIGYEDYYIGAWKKCFVFTGRARRTEYWVFTLFNGIVFLVLECIAAGAATNEEMMLMAVMKSIFAISCIPQVSLGVRRLHDTGNSGWLALLWLVPIIGWVMLFFYFIQNGDIGDNKYGSDPKEGGGSSGD